MVEGGPEMELNLAREHCMKSSTKNQSTIGSSIELILWLRLDDHNIQVKFESFKLMLNYSPCEV